MKFKILLLLALISPSIAFPAEWKSFNEGLKLAKQQNKPVIVDFFAEWCSWCVKMDKEVLSRPDISGILKEKFIAVRVDADSNEQISFEGKNFTPKSFMGFTEIDGLPTFLFISPDGKIIGSQPGYIKADEFKMILGFISDGCYKKITYKKYKENGGKCN